MFLDAVEHAVHRFALAQASRDPGKFRQRNEMRCNSGIDHIRGSETRAGESEIHPELARQARQKITSADVGKESDPGFRHCEERVFAGHTMRTMDGNTYAAAHGHT